MFSAGLAIGAIGQIVVFFISNAFPKKTHNRSQTS